MSDYVVPLKIGDRAELRSTMSNFRITGTISGKGAFATFVSDPSVSGRSTWILRVDLKRGCVCWLNGTRDESMTVRPIL